MRYANLGATGLKVSRICLGMMSYGTPGWQGWILDEAQARPFFREALDLGINFFDTADAYSNGVSEQILGRLIKDHALSREQVVVATKVFFPTGATVNQAGLSRKHIRHAIDNSLTRLGLDYVDLYQIHRFDPATPLEETLEALDEVVRAGKALHIGASSAFAWQLMKALGLQRQHGWARFVSMQNHYNLVYREEEREMNPLCVSEGVGIIPWSPLARGFLVGNRPRGVQPATKRGESDAFARHLYQDDDFTIVEQVSEVAARRGVTGAQVALSWLLAKPGIVAPVIGVTKPHHLKDAVAALDLALSAKEIEALEAPYRPHPVLGHAYDNPLGAPARPG